MREQLVPRGPWFVTKSAHLGRALGLIGLLACLLIAPAAFGPSARAAGNADAGNPNPGVLPPNASPHGKSYPEWAAAWWQALLEFPFEDHPALSGSPEDALLTGHAGKVYFGAVPVDSGITRSATLPSGASLFLGLLNVECSSLEDPPFHGDTEAEQRACAKFFADRIVPEDLFCTIDGVPLGHLDRYRVGSPQIEFTAPTPWLFGAEGGDGTSVGDGYFLMLAPLSAGKHTIHLGGRFHFNAGDLGDDPFDLPVDITINLTVK